MTHSQSGQTADLIAVHAAILPHWLNYLDHQRAEQIKLQGQMRAQGNAESTRPNPVAWLMGAPRSSPAPTQQPSAQDQGATQEEQKAEGFSDPFGAEEEDPFAPVAALTADAPLPDPAHPSATETGAAGAGGLSDTSFGFEAGHGFPAPVGNTDDSGAKGRSASGERSWLDAFEGDFGGEVSREFAAAFDAADQTALPYDLQQTLQFGDTPEEVAAAFVRAERAGQLDPRLDAAIERMSEVDYTFADARRRADSPTTEDDDEPLF